MNKLFNETTLKLGIDNICNINYVCRNYRDISKNIDIKIKKGILKHTIICKIKNEFTTSYRISRFNKLDLVSKLHIIILDYMRLDMGRDKLFKYIHDIVCTPFIKDSEKMVWIYEYMLMVISDIEESENIHRIIYEYMNESLVSQDFNKIYKSFKDLYNHMTKCHMI